MTSPMNSDAQPHNNIPPQGPGFPQQPPQAAASPLADIATNRTNQFVVGGAASAFIGLIGCFGPWATFGPLTVAGTAGDGVFVLFLLLIGGGALASLLFTAAPWRQYLPIASLVAGGLAFLLTLISLTNVSNMSGGGLFSVSPGWGLFVTLLGSAGLIAAAALVQFKK